jgi:hypothetical protein
MAITTPRTQQQIQQDAASQVNSEVQGQVTPVQGQLTATQQSQQNAVAQAGQIYGQILPYVSGSAKRVEDMYNQGTQVEKGIFDTATSA